MCVEVMVDPANVRPSESVKTAVCRQVVLVAISQVPPREMTRQRCSENNSRLLMLD